MSEDKNTQNDDLRDENIVNRETNEKITETIVENEEKNDTKTKNNKIKMIAITAVVGVLCLGAGYVSGKEAGRKLPATSKSYSSGKVMATVGETNITGADIAARMEPLFYLNGKEEMSEEQILAYESSMLDYMTTTEILYLEGKAAKIEATDEEIQTEYDSLISSIQSTFKMSEEDYLKQFKITKERIKADLEKELIATKYIGQASEVNDTEAKNYYDKNKDEFLQIRASHILIQTKDEEGNALSEEDKEKSKKKAQEILDRIKSGEDFAALAKEYSQDSSSANGGDLDFFGKGQMVEPFEKAAYALKTGEVSNELVETDFGYHIIKKTDEQYDEFENVKEDLKYKLSYEKQENLITDLMEKYNVAIKE